MEPEIFISKKTQKTLTKWFVKKDVFNKSILLISDDTIPANCDVYNIFLGKQSSKALKLYAKNKEKLKKLFLDILVKDAKLSLIVSMKHLTALYIAASEEKDYNEVKFKDHVWPMVLVDDSNSSLYSKFKHKYKKGMELTEFCKLQLKDKT